MYEDTPKRKPLPKDYGLSHQKVDRLAKPDLTNYFETPAIFVGAITGLAFGIYFWATDPPDDFLGGICFLVIVAVAGFVIVGVPIHLAVAFIWRKLERRSNNLAKLYSYQRDLANYEAELKEEQDAYERALQEYLTAKNVRQEAASARLSKSEDFWRALSGPDFELEVERLYKRLGFHVKTTPTSGDAGVDLIVMRDRAVIIVQCKAYKNPAGPAIARELFGTMVHFGADKGVLACTGGFTRGVYEFVYDKNIELLDAVDLAIMAQTYRESGR